MLTARTQFKAIALNKHIYAIGGFSEVGQLALPVMERYSEATSQWEEVKLSADYLTPRASLSAQRTHENKILILGGGDGLKNFDELLEFDPENNSVEKKTSPPSMKVGSHLLTVDGYDFVVIGGYKNETVYAYSTEDGKWLENKKYTQDLATKIMGINEPIIPEDLHLKLSLFCKPSAVFFI